MMTVITHGGGTITVPNSQLTISDVSRIWTDINVTSVTYQYDANDVRQEASRRMQLLLGARSPEHLQIKISNGNREAIRLQEKRVSNIEDPTLPPLTQEEEDRRTLLKTVDVAMEAIRSASDVLENTSPVPDNYRDNSYWPPLS